MRTNTTLFDSDAVRVRAVRCLAPAGGCGPIEWSAAHTIVFPERGVFVKHVARHISIVADRAHAVFFTADRPYRVSHPVTGGDDCLVLELRAAVLADVLNEADPAAAESPNLPFRRAAVRLTPGQVVRRRLLRHRLVRHLADALEVEETATELLRESIRATVAPPPKQARTRRNETRRVEMAHATQVSIASRPSARWTLAALAREVDCSPFHLAHLFREVTGGTIHQYHVRARLVAALDDILDTDRGLGAIALDAGFAHHSHFSSAFRQTFGVTPSALRRLATSKEIARLRKFLTALPSTRG